METVRLMKFEPPDPKVDSAFHWTNHYQVDNAISFGTSYPLDRDLSGG